MPALEAEPGGRVAAAARKRGLADPRDEHPGSARGLDEGGDLWDDRQDRADVHAGTGKVPVGMAEVVLHVDDDKGAVPGIEDLLVALEHRLAEQLSHVNGSASGRIGAPVAPRMGMQAP